MGEGFYVDRVGGEPTCPRGKRAKCQHSVLSGTAGNEASLLARKEEWNPFQGFQATIERTVSNPTRSAFRNPWFIRLRGFRTSVFGPKYPLFYPLFFQNGHVKWESSYTRLYMDPLLIVTISLHPVGYRHLYHVKTEEWFRTVNFRVFLLTGASTNWNLSVSLINPSHASFGIHLVFIIIPG